MTIEDENKELRERIQALMETNERDRAEVARLKHRNSELQDEINHLQRLREAYMRRSRPAIDKMFEEGNLAL